MIEREIGDGGADVTTEEKHEAEKCDKSAKVFGVMSVPLITKINIHENGGEIKTANDINNLHVLEVEVADQGEDADNAKND